MYVGDLWRKEIFDYVTENNSEKRLERKVWIHLPILEWTE